MIFTAAAALGATILGVSAGTINFATIAVGFLAQTAMGLALSALTPKPKSLGANRGYQVNSRGGALDHQIIYGRAKVGGALVFETTFEGTTDDPDVDNQFLYQVYAHAAHSVDGYQDVYIDNKLVTEWRLENTYEIVSGPDAVPNGTGLVPYTVCDTGVDGTVIGSQCNNRYGLNYDGLQMPSMVLKFYDGTQTEANPTLITDLPDKWTTEHVLNDTAYMIAKMGFDARSYPNGVPEILCTIRGKNTIYDPRTGGLGYTDNPALILNDYITSGFGLGEDQSNVDIAQLTFAADICQQLTSEGQLLYTCNGAFATQVSPHDIISDLITSMAGLVWYSQGKWRMKPAYWVAPTLSLNEDDLRSSIGVKTRHSRRDNFNVVKGTFRGPETSWQVTDYPEVTQQIFVDIDGGQESVVDFDLPFTDNSTEARRLALIMLERNRQQLTVTASFGLRAFKAQVGDVIELSVARFGWVAKTFEVTSWTFGLVDGSDLQVQMTLREITEEVFNEVPDGILFDRDNGTPPDPAKTAIPQNLLAVDSGFIDTDGSYQNGIKVTWTTSQPTLVEGYSIEWKKQSDVEYNNTSLEARQYSISGVESEVTYDIRVRSVNVLGYFSDYATTTFTPSRDLIAPSSPTNLAAAGDLSVINLTWLNPTDPDFKETEIWESTSPVFGTAIKIADAAGSSYIRGNLAPLTLLYYWIRSVDHSGNASAFVGPVSGLTRQITTSDIASSIIPWDAMDPSGDAAIAAEVDSLRAEVAGEYATITTTSLIENDVNGLQGKYGVTVDLNGNISGFQLLSGVGGSAFNVRADQFAVFNSTGTAGDTPFTIFTSPRFENGVVFPAGTYIQNAFIDYASIVDASVDTLKIKGNSVTVPLSSTDSLGIVGGGAATEVQFVNLTMDVAGYVLITWSGSQGYASEGHFHETKLYVGGSLKTSRGGVATNDMPNLAWSGPLSAGTHRISIYWSASSSDVILNNATLTAFGVKR